MSEEDRYGIPSGPLAGLLSLIFLSLLFARPAQSQTTKPNVVFILVDNVGWGDVGVYGG